MLIYVPKVNNRVSYVFNFMLGTILQLPFSITDDPQEFLAYPREKFSYSDKPFGDELFFNQTGLLFYDNLTIIEIQLTTYNSYNVPFPVSAGAFPFDVFAAAFYLLSRYEEYDHIDPDIHDRYKAENTLAWKCGFLERPVVDEWSYEIKKLFISRFPSLNIPSRKVSFIPTVDIDRAYAYKHSPAWLIAARLIKSALTADKSTFSRIAKTLSGKRKDPFDVYDDFDSIHTNAEKPVFFFLVGDKTKHDPGFPYRSKTFAKLVQRTGETAEIGIHPSYASNSDQNLLPEEIERFEKVLNMRVKISRQHFLKMKLPETYQQLIKQGIEEDYSMGFASQVGFRAGTCTPFFWFDLTKNQKTNLRIVPFAAMDATLNRYLKLSPEQALEKLKTLFDSVKTVDGTFCLLWHNESLSEMNGWQHWTTVYRQIVAYAIQNP